MIKFIFRDSVEAKIIHSDIIVDFLISPYTEIDNDNNEVLHLTIKTKSKELKFRICTDDRQGYDLDKIKEKIITHYGKCVCSKFDYSINDYKQRYYIHIGDNNPKEHYYETYTGSLLEMV